MADLFEQVLHVHGSKKRDGTMCQKNGAGRAQQNLVYLVAALLQNDSLQDVPSAIDIVTEFSEHVLTKHMRTLLFVVFSVLAAFDLVQSIAGCEVPYSTRQ